MTFRPGNPRPAESGPRFPVPGRIGNRGFPVSRRNRESGIPSPIPGRKSGIGGSDSRFPSDVRALTVTAVDSEYTQRLSCQCSHRQHAAPIQGLSRSMLLRVTSINRSGLGIYSAASSITGMPLWRARATGSPQDTWSRTRGSYSG